MNVIAQVMMINTKTGNDHGAATPEMDIQLVCDHLVCIGDGSHFSLCDHSQLFWPNQRWEHDHASLYTMGGYMVLPDIYLPQKDL